MKFLSLFILVFSLSSPVVADHDEADLTVKEQVQLCVDTCLSFEEAGYQLKSCLAGCEDLIEADSTERYCNTDEEDCDRPDDPPLF